MAPRASAVSGWRNHPWLRREVWTAAAPKLATVLTFAITIHVFLLLNDSMNSMMISP